MEEACCFESAQTVTEPFDPNESYMDHAPWQNMQSDEGNKGAMFVNQSIKLR